MNELVIVLQLLCGAAGGYIAGARFEGFSLGAFADSMAGIAGGSLGGQVLQSCCGCDFRSTDIEIFLTSCIGGLAGGAIMSVLLGVVKWSFRHRP
jgi:hypothetical protein